MPASIPLEYGQRLFKQDELKNEYERIEMKQKPY